LYGGVFALLSVGFIGGSQLNHILTKKSGNRQILKTTLLLQAIIAVLFLIGSLNGWLTLPAVIILLFLLLSCCGITYPNAAALCMAPFSKNAGTASALLGFLQIGIGAVVSGCTGLLPFTAIPAMAVIMTVTTGIALAVLHLSPSTKAVA
jgi:MFS transporter, DHA1 family, multidrug resistance protein